MSTTVSPGGSGRIPSLDGLRTLSVLIVMSAHAGYGDLVPGGLGVTVFFFLSGFLITRLLYEEYGRTQSINLPYFYARRFLRLTPPLYVTLAIAYALAAFGLIGGSITGVGALAQLTYLANYQVLFFAAGNGVPAGTGILWSLAVEEHFYLVFPPLLLWLLRKRTPTQIFTVLAAACAAALVWRMVLVGGEHFSANRTYYATDTRFDSIIYGSLYALYEKFRGGVRATPDYAFWRRHSGAFALGGLALIGASLAYREADFRETWRYSLQGLALMPIFMHCTKSDAGWSVGWLNTAVMQRLGVYSYAMYLIHDVIIRGIRWTPTFSGEPWLVLLVAIVGAVAYAAFIDTVVDPRLRAMRHRFAS